MRIAFDGVKQMPRGTPANLLQIVVERGDWYAAFGGGDRPIVMPDDFNVLGYAKTPIIEGFDGTTGQHVVQAIDAVDMYIVF